jgi:anti-sigma regulatory factor (Ser/Thr protein kinase)
MESIAEIAEVLVSELVTNAVKACGDMTGTCPLLLWVLPGGAGVLLVVWDASPLPPVRSPAGAGAESGRGLMLVDALSERWGWRSAAGGGKFVWAVLGCWPGSLAGRA